MPGTNKATETTQAQNLLLGFQKHLASVASLTLASVAYTPTQIAAALSLLVTLRQAVEAAEAVAKAKLAAEESQAPALLSLMAALVSYVKLTFSESPDVLADFGLEPKKTATPLTTEQQAVAVAKRNATREARGTTSKKAKKSVKGNVVGVVVTPVTAGTQVAAPSATPSSPAAPPPGSDPPTRNSTLGTAKLASVKSLTMVSRALELPATPCKFSDGTIVNGTP